MAITSSTAAGGVNAGLKPGDTNWTPVNAQGQPLTAAQIQRQKARIAARNAPAPSAPAPAAPAPPVDPNVVTQTSLADNAKEWAQDTLQGDFSRNPLFAEMTDAQYSDPTTNPHIQAMVESLKGEVKEDWLGNMAALTESAEQGGRFGGDYYASMRTRAGEEADEALAGQIAGLYTGAYENERNRRAGLFNSISGVQESAARLPIEFGNLAANQLGAKASLLGAQASMKNARTGAASFRFDKQMTLLNGQQDALNDYFGLLSGIGGLGGTQTGTGTYAPQANPWVAGLLGGASGALSAYGSQYGGR